MPFQEKWLIISINETSFFKDMFKDKTKDFTGPENVIIKTDDREKYFLRVLLSLAGNRWKLLTPIVVKGEEGKTIEKNFRKLPYCQNGQLLLYCNKEDWCTNKILEEQIYKRLYSPY